MGKRLNQELASPTSRLEAKIQERSDTNKGTYSIATTDELFFIVFARLDRSSTKAPWSAKMDMHLGICIFYCLGFLPLRLAFTGLEDWKESIVFLSTHRWCETSTQGTTGASWGLGLKCAISNIAANTRHRLSLSRLGTTFSTCTSAPNQPPNTQASWAYLIPARRVRPLVTGPLKAAKVTHHLYTCKATRLPHNNFFIVISSHQQLLPCDNTQHLTPRQRNPTKTSTYFFLSVANKELKSPQILTGGKNPLFFLK